MERLVDRFSKTTITIGLPTLTAFVLSLLLAGAQVVNELVLNISPDWHAYISIILVFFAGIGISPLVGDSFRAAIHLPPIAGYLLSAILAAVLLALYTVALSGVVHVIASSVIIVFTSLGFAPAATLIVPPVYKS